MSWNKRAKINVCELLLLLSQLKQLSEGLG